MVVHVGLRPLNGRGTVVLLRRGTRLRLLCCVGACSSHRLIATSVDIAVVNPRIVTAFEFVPDVGGPVGGVDLTSVGVALQRDGSSSSKLAERVVVGAGAATHPDVPHLGGVEHLCSDVVRTRRRCRDSRSGDHQQQAHTERHQPSCFARLVHRNPPRAELRQSSDRNFDVLHDVLLVSGGGTRVHPIRAPGAI